MHLPVLLHETIDSLDLHPGQILVDGTLGHGGHTEAVVNLFHDSVRIIGIDQDEDAIDRTKKRLKGQKSDITYVHGNFRDLDSILKSLKLESVDRILLDIGLSSNQFEESGRGFSFQKDEPLIMSFKRDLSPEDLTAREIVNNWDEENIRAILMGYGEEQFSYRIAKAIERYRKVKPIETTSELVDIIMSATPKFYHFRKIHPATKTFQALRITVNDEIESLKKGLTSGFGHLSAGGRLAVISFHSLEDRVVKQFFKEKEKEVQGKSITKKPIVPGEEEIAQNPRSRSAKLRVISKN